MWKCWVCDEKGRKISTLLYRLGYVTKEIREILQDYDETSIKVEESIEKVLRLPPSYNALWRPNHHSYEYKNALRYVKQRGLRVVDIFRYHVGYDESGKFKDRLIIPSYDKDNKLNYFTTRRYYDGGVKYYNPPMSKNVVIFENLINWNLPIVLVEGMFDAIAVRRNAIPLMGKVMSPLLQRRIIENRPPHVYVMLDSDANKESHEIEYYLKNININVSHVPTMGKDAADMGFIESWKLINRARPSSFVELVESKL